MAPCSSAIATSSSPSPKPNESKNRDWLHRPKPYDPANHAVLCVGAWTVLPVPVFLPAFIRGSMNRRSFLLGLPALTCLRAANPLPDAWPQFRGNPQLTGVAASTLPATLKLLWTYEAGDSIESSAAIVDGAVYVLSLIHI